MTFASGRYFVTVNREPVDRVYAHSCTNTRLAYSDRRYRAGAARKPITENKPEVDDREGWLPRGITFGTLD
jgi:hypothetical protein